MGSLLASAIVYILVGVFNLRFPTIAYLLFWRKARQDLIILLSEVPLMYDPTIRPGSQPPLTPAGDAVSLGVILHFLKSRLRTKPEVVTVGSAAEYFNRYRTNNMILIGGPKYNRAAYEFLAEMDVRMEYQFARVRGQEQSTDVDDLSLKRFISRDSTIRPDISLDNTTDSDVGMVVVARNPYNNEKMIAFVGGLTTLSTLAATTWLLRRNVRVWMQMRLRKAMGFQAIISGRSSDSIQITNVTLRVVSYIESV